MVVRDIREANNRGEMIFGNRPGKILPDHLFSGFLRYSKCGSNLVLASGKAGGYYGCNDYHMGTKTCKNKSLIKRSRLENALLESMEHIISNEAWLEKLASRANANAGESYFIYFIISVLIKSP